MDVKRFDVVTVAETATTIFTVPNGKAYTVTGLSVVESAGESGEMSFKIGNHVVGEFGIAGPDTIYPVTNINLAAGESLTVTASIAGIYVTASIVERDV